MSVELDGVNNILKTDTISEVTSANGVTIDGVNIKDSKIVTANSVDSDVYVDGSIDTAHIADLNVTTGKIAADAITGAKIADNAINSEHYTDGSIDTAHIAADQITNAKIADDQIDSEHYVDGSIDTAHLAADAVTGAKIADDAINSEHYTDGSIDTAHIADGQVTIGKLATAVLTGATDIGAALADADLFLVDDGAGGTLRKTAASRLKTYIGGGITGADQYRVSGDFDDDADPITNFERADTDGYGGIGTAMTYSSGIFTFPTTGYWLIDFTAMFYHNNESRFNNATCYTTTNNSSYGISNYGSCLLQITQSDNAYGCASSSFIFDVTDTTTHKCKFASDVSAGGATMAGSTGTNQTIATFIRLGDT